jgi:hypothetical protein
MAVHPATEVAALLGLLEPYEPLSSLAIGPLADYGLGRNVRAWVADGPDGSTGGVLVLWRMCRDRWRAMVWLFDPSGAEPLGKQLDRSPAHAVIGLHDHVGPVLEHTSRTRLVQELPLWAGRPMDTDEMLADERARLATPEDLEALVEVYRTYELDPFPTVPRLRGYLREMLAMGRPIVVVEQDGRVVGAIRCDARTERWLFWNAAGVLPEYRGRGLSWSMTWRLVAVTKELGRGIVTSRAPTNPVPRTRVITPEVLERADFVEDILIEAHLKRRVRVRGMGKLVKLLERIEGPVRKRVPPDAYAERDSGGQTWGREETSAVSPGGEDSSGEGQEPTGQ